MQPQGLYDPRFEHDACGVGFIVDMKGRRSHSIVRQALQVLINLAHRGACGCEENTGDGAGILTQVPDKFLRKVAPAPLPPVGEYGVGLVFLPHDAAARTTITELFARIIAEEGQTLLGWRDVPTDDGLVGPSAVAVEPAFAQVFIGRSASLTGAAARERFERKLYVIRKRLENAVDATASIDAGTRKLGVIMGDDVKTGINSMIEPGTIIWERSIIGMGAIAKGEIGPDSRIF